MRLVIITQDDPFYLPTAISYLLRNLPSKFQVVGVVLLDGSVRGKKQSFIRRAIDTFNVFGLQFFLYYMVKYIFYRLKNGMSLRKVVRKEAIDVIQLQQPINHENSLELIKKYEPDILISVAGNEIFKENLINLAPMGCLNLHTGKLPQYRGLMPTFWALLNHEHEIGVSVFFVDEGIDSGPIVVQRLVPIMQRVQSELIRETKIVGMECIIEALELIKGGTYTIVPNTNDQATYYGFPTKNDVKAFTKSGARFF